MLKITVLIDNVPHPEREDLQAEHGLSFYIEKDGRKILCDMGASAAFLANAERLNVNLSDVDFAFLSHGHADHSGGLGAFLQVNEVVPVMVSSSVFSQNYYSTRRGAKRNISTETCLLSVYPQRFVLLKESCWIAKDIAVVRNETHRYPKPLGNAFLTVEDSEGERLDEFEHELALVFCTEAGLVVVSSCSHGGAMNIIETCRRFTGVDKMVAFVGGLHFVDGEEVESEVRSFTAECFRLFPDMKVFTGHCTGSMAREIILEEKRCVFFHTGKEIEINFK